VSLPAFREGVQTGKSRSPLYSVSVRAATALSLQSAPTLGPEFSRNDC
jgi:hypothetical protein